MKKLFILITAASVAVIACSKNENTAINCDAVTIKAPDNEITALRAYLDTNHIAYTADPRGFFYHIDTTGGSSRPSVCNSVNVSYAGYLLNGTTFDQNADASFGLSGVIIGWQEAVPLIGSGGRIIMYLPPSLGYGSQSSDKIPANSNLKFVVTLKAIL